MQTTLTTFHADDLPSILAIEQEIFPYPWTLGNFKDALSSGYECHALRSVSPENSQEILGYRVTMVVLDELHLLNVSVAKPHQGRGFGRWLVQDLIKQRSEQAKECVLLEVRPSNHAALGLYEQLGFERVGLRKGYYPAAQGREDALVLRYGFAR